VPGETLWKMGMCIWGRRGKIFKKTLSLAQKRRVRGKKREGTQRAPSRDSSRGQMSGGLSVEIPSGQGEVLKNGKPSGWRGQTSPWSSASLGKEKGRRIKGTTYTA